MSCSLRIGAKLGYQWTFLYHGAYQNNVGPVNVEILDGINPAIRNPFGPFVETDIRNASTLLNGTFTLAIGGYCDTVNVSVLESEEIWQQKINSLPGVNGALLIVEDAECKGDGCFIFYALAFIVHTRDHASTTCHTT